MPLTESAFIAALRSLPLHPGAQRLEDDAAVVEFGGEALVLTHDAIAEGVHFLPGTDPADIAWKLVAVNLSDLAAKGADPVGVLVGATLSDERFVSGLKEVLDRHAVPLLGGDTIALPTGAPQVFGCTAVGRATHRPVPRRGGARPGDELYITGAIGAAMIGFRDNGEAYRRPRPLLEQGRALAPRVSAMMDVSDGLLIDAARMAGASNCTAALELDSIPFAAMVRADERHAALRWGDDYQLLFALPPGSPSPVPAHRIGALIDAAAHPLLIDGEPALGPLGYEHR